MSNAVYPHDDLAEGAVGIIVKDVSGALMANQAGGFACNHPETRGFFTEINLPCLDRLEAICGDGWMPNISQEEAKAIDALLSESGMRCDPDFLYDWKRGLPSDRSQEAWIHVIDLHNRKCVLLWANSD